MRLRSTSLMWLIAVLWLSSADSVDAKTCRSISSNDITFNFSSERPCGQYVSGDWWVVAPVTITSMTPNATSSSHGWNVNPCIIGLNGCTQPYDDNRPTNAEIRSFSRSSQPNLPYKASAGQSIVKARSFNVGGPCDGSADKGCISDFAILTVVGSEPSPTEFRPPYVGNSKPRYDFAKVDLNRLPDLPSAPGEPSWGKVESSLRGPFVDHMITFRSRFLHARNGVSRFDGGLADYGADISVAFNGAILKTAFNHPDSAKDFTVKRMIQIGIDLYHMALMGQHWEADSGHASGRKLPILYAGLLLDDAGMLGIGKDAALARRSSAPCGSAGTRFKMRWQEDDQTYFGQNKVALWGEIKLGCGGKYGGDPGYSNFLESSCERGSKSAGDPNGLVDGGIRVHKYGSGPDPGGCRPILSPAESVRRKNAFASTYMHCCTTGPYVGAEIAARLLGLRSAWNHEPFFQYMARMRTPPWSNNGATAYFPSWFRNVQDAFDACADAGSCPGQSGQAPPPRPQPPRLIGIE